MKLKKLYESIISAGIDADPRGEACVRRGLERTKEGYGSLPQKEKPYFDTDNLWNPYNDSRLLNGNPDAEITTIMAGIDIDSAELLLIDRLNSKGGQKIDLALSHHPQGIAYAGLYEVMEVQTDIYGISGVPINLAEGLVHERKREIERRIHSSNHQRAVNTAKLLDMPFMCAHTPADNHAVSYLSGLLEEKKPQTVEKLIDVLMDIEEYRIAAKAHNLPQVLFGRPQSRVGKIFIDMTGGTEGPKDIVEHFVTAGIGTIVGMHLSEEMYKKLQGKNINVVIAGHISSDSLGMNLLLDKIEKISPVSILQCSGFTRVKRN